MGSFGVFGFAFGAFAVAGAGLAVASGSGAGETAGRTVTAPSSRAALGVLPPFLKPQTAKSAPATRPPLKRGAALPSAFSFADVVAKARALASSPYAAAAPKTPAAAAALDYDQYRRIEFRREAADWSEAPESAFHVHYETRGFLFNSPIAINLVESGETLQRPFDPSDFNFFDLPLSAEDKTTLGFAGFHVTSPLNSAGKFDDIINFKGASFFRALGAGNAYGASARGLAISTASPNGEEFPAFREFWLERPKTGDNKFSIYALLDSPSLAGAFRFEVTPGAQTVVDVEATLFPRRDVAEAGVAPLTSMFDFGPQDPANGRQDFRPRVHDSDGFMFRLRNGEWAWRPLINPARLEVSSFAEQTPIGFGLVQRERRFSAYDDLEAQYEKRPSIWVAPKDDWGRGRLMLIEIPTANEFNDNIVAFWRPETPWKKGEEVRLAYTMYWGLETPVQPTVARVQSTKTGVAASGARLFIVDFESENASLFDGAVASVTTSQGAVANVTLTRNAHTGGARLSFELENAGAAAELRAVLNRGDRAVSETWLYRWSAS